MSRRRGLEARAAVWGLALLTIVMIGAEAPLFADRQASSTRSSEGAKPQSMSRDSGPPASSSTGRSASPTAKSSSSSRRSAVSTRQSTPASRGRVRSTGSRRHHHLGLHFGYGYGYYGYGPYYGSYYYPFYYHPYYWGVPYYVPRRARTEYELGALDLNVRPKKSEVYLDGQYIGTAGQYDGFPGHLWLEGGSYELIFYRPGFATEKRILTVYPGIVVDVRVRLVAGESVPAEELSTVDRSGALAEVRSAYDRQKQVEAAPPPPARRRASGAQMDTRAAPGRVRLNVQPADASVYLDGRLLGSGDELTRLHTGLVVDAGSHLLEVVRPGYATERVEFSVESGDEVELEVLLDAG